MAYNRSREPKKCFTCHEEGHVRRIIIIFSSYLNDDISTSSQGIARQRRLTLPPEPLLIGRRYILSPSFLTKKSARLRKVIISRGIVIYVSTLIAFIHIFISHMIPTSPAKKLLKNAFFHLLVRRFGPFLIMILKHHRTRMPVRASADISSRKMTQQMDKR